jgi:hypothetical protein
MSITIISYTKKVSDIANLSSLPYEVVREIKAVGRIDSYGFQALNGYDGRQCVWSAGGYWNKDAFEVTSYGSLTYQWDGEYLRTTSNIVRHP